LDGNILVVFFKPERSQPISAHEKKLLGEIKYPSHRAYFKGLLNDEKGRIYILRTKSILDKSQIEEIDIFSQEGIWLYRTSLKYVLKVIRNGCIYVIAKDEKELRGNQKAKD